jgi:2-isopropylmalate synthase
LKSIRIFDTTLRDGEQTPGVSFTPEEKLEIALQLDKLRVDTIEAGFPAASEGEQKAFRDLINVGLKAEVCALTRTMRKDIDEALKCNPDSIHTFISTSNVQMKHALGMMPEQVLKAAVSSIQYIKDHGILCEFSPMDATRTDYDFLREICKAAEEAGADRINIPDTVGIIKPQGIEKMIRDLKAIVKVPLSVHCHNDFGLAVANSLAGVVSGVTQVHVAVNGLGERAGNASLEEVVMALHLIYNMKTNINTNRIYSTSKLVSRLSGVMIQPNKAIIGENAFAHESGIHTRGVTIEPLTFEPFNPEIVGRQRRLAPGKLAGKHGIKAELKEGGINPTETELLEIVNRIKDLGDKGKLVTDADLFAIARTIMGETLEEKIVELTDFTVTTGVKVIPTASVKILVDGKEYMTAETGVGPVNAAIKAIQKITNKLADVRLTEYRLEALTGGSDAVAEVIIKVEDKDGIIVSARGAREDIVMASVEAMISGINKLLIKRKNK